MDLEFGMETKFDMENMKIKEKLEIDTYLINYAQFVKTGPMSLKFGMEVKLDTENMNMKENIEN